MSIEMKKIVIDTTNEETYKESLSELFDYDDEKAGKSFDKHHSFGRAGVYIGNIVKDAFNLPHIASYCFNLHDLGDKKTLLVVAWVEK